VRRFLDAVASRPATWRIILLPLEGTPAIVRDHVEQNRARIQDRIEHHVRWAQAQLGLAHGTDPALTAWAIRSLGEEAGRAVLTDPERYPAERFEQFITAIMQRAWAPAASR
jgi:hypothetical protein